MPKTTMRSVRVDDTIWKPHAAAAVQADMTMSEVIRGLLASSSPDQIILAGKVRKLEAELHSWRERAGTLQQENATLQQAMLEMVRREIGAG